jgi:hypothetical protein
MAKRYYTVSFHNGGRKEDTKDTKGNGKAVKFQANREHNIRDEEYCKNQEHIGFKREPDQTDEDWAKRYEEWTKIHVLFDEKPEEAYERIFGEAIKEYDAKQTRSDRKIKNGKNYYEKLKKSKNKVPVYEFIITLGNKDNLPDNPEEVRQIYIEALNDFKKRNPNLEVIGAYYHDDETRDDGKGGRIQGAPHIHVDYIPVARNRWQKFQDEQNKKENPVTKAVNKIKGTETKKRIRVNGMDVENSLTEALAGQGFTSKEMDPSAIERKFGIHLNEKHFKDPERQAQYEEFMQERVDEKGIKTRLVTAQMQWIKNERDCLIRLFEKHGYKIKNPGEHRPHLETQDYIESKDMNLQEKNLELYNELSSKLDFVGSEEKELSEKKNALDEREASLNAKEDSLNKKETELKEWNEVLESKANIVEVSESQLEEAKNINEENKAVFAQIEEKEKNIGLIKEELYSDVRAEVDNEYRSKFKALSDKEEEQKKKDEELKEQKDKQEETERLQKAKADELTLREAAVVALEQYKKSLEEREKAVQEREDAASADEKTNKEKETDLKKREDALIKDKKDLETSKNLFNKKLQEKTDEITGKENFLNELKENYDLRMAEINDWAIAGDAIQNIEPEKWFEKEYKEAIKNKLPLPKFIKLVGDGIKGFIANLKKSYDTLLHGHKNYYNDSQGNIVCEYSFGCQDFTDMLLETPVENIKLAITECEEKGKKTFSEMAQDDNSGFFDLSFFEKHFKKAKEIKRDIERTIDRERERNMGR